MIFDYLDGGADDEITLRRNKDAYSELELHYPVLSGMEPTDMDLSTRLFLQTLQIPFFACPTAGNCMFHLQGERAVARASQERGMCYSLSSLSTTSMDDIVHIFHTHTSSHAKKNETIHTTAPPSPPLIFQLYVWKDWALVQTVLEQAKQAGFNALALTVDVSWMGNWECDVRNAFTISPQYSWQQTYEATKRPAWTFDFLSHEPFKYACINQDIPAESLVQFINSQLTPDFSWKDAEWLLGEWNGLAAIKGIVRPDDAVMAQHIGFDCIWISNHGGRQMDTAPATIDVLPSIRQAVGPDMDIVLDGGIQCGTDIVKALALGANAVGIGRPFLWGLAAGGYQGVAKAFDILQVELDRAMGLLGTPTIQALQENGPSLVKRRHASARDYPDVYAAERGYSGGVV